MKMKNFLPKDIAARGSWTQWKPSLRIPGQIEACEVVIFLALSSLIRSPPLSPKGGSGPMSPASPGVTWLPAKRASGPAATASQAQQIEV